jgi:HNH endonuclease
MSLTVRRVGLVEFPGYEVGDDGFVWSYWKQRGPFPAFLTAVPRQLKRQYDPNGYPIHTLYRDGKPYIRFVHRLVLEAFVGPRPPGMECRHFPDKNKSSCALNNLSWGSPKQNAADKNLQDGHIRGDKNGNAKLSPQDIPVIRQLLAAGVSRRKIASRFGVGSPLIDKIAWRQRWDWIP